MQYLLMVGNAPDSSTHEWGESDDAAAIAWVTEMDQRGVRKVGNRLLPPEESRTVRIRGGELLVTEGPFVEGKEYIGGFDVLECADLDEAIEVVRKHPMAKYGLVEIHPTWPFDFDAI